jgi:hypothetical protein
MILNRIYVLCVFCLFLTGKILPQYDPVNYDYVYLDNIRSVQLKIPNLQTSYPIVELGNQRLHLSFDEIGTDTRYLRYRIEHCTREWLPSELEELEFLDGFNGEELRDFGFSVNTRIPFVHYDLLLPNRDIQWTKSGNYLLHVYDEITGEYLLTRRFLVVEPIMKIFANLSKPSNVSKINTHHEIDFTATHKEFRIPNPRREIFASVMQNGRWDNAIVDIPPYLVKHEELTFDYQDKIVFPAGKEFRNIDFRSLKSGSRRIVEINEFEDAYEIRLETDERRTFQNYHTEKDLNGQFVIQTLDDRNQVLEPEYVYVLFSLKSSQPVYEQDVFLIGGFTDWLIDDRFRLNYEDRYGAYRAEVLLKQGVYDYLYVTSEPSSQGGNYEEFEGSWHESENYYTILIYYRPFGGRYDRLIGATTIGEK